MLAALRSRLPLWLQRLALALLVLAFFWSAGMLWVPWLLKPQAERAIGEALGRGVRLGGEAARHGGHRAADVGPVAAELAQAAARQVGVDPAREFLQRTFERVTHALVVVLDFVRRIDQHQRAARRRRQQCLEAVEAIAMLDQHTAAARR